MRAPVEEPRAIALEPLTRAGFAPFGDALGLSLAEGDGRAANQGTARRHDHAARVVNTRPGAATPNLALFRSVGRALPVTVPLLERHPASTQLFVPLGDAEVIVVVAPTADDPRRGPALDAARAFHVRPGQGVSYHPGTWHAPIIALEADAELLMLAHEAQSDDDCEERPLDVPLLVTRDAR